MSNKLLVVIGGPTGVGKTAAAIRLALHFNTEIVSADSRQVYKELHIGVGRPSQEQLLSVPHYLIGHTSILEPYSAGHFTQDALAILEMLFLRHDVVILTGGTGLYIKAILEGMHEIPSIPAEVTDQWTRIWKERGTEALLQELQILDPEFIKSVDPSNYMRLIRALAVTSFTGKPFSSFHKGSKVNRPFRVFPVLLEIPREELYACIDRRVTEMLDHGWLEEAKALYPHRHLKALQTVGYTELFDFLEGTMDLPETIKKIQQSTRRYAKRQMTWWRHQGQWHSFHPEDVDVIIKAINHELEI